MTINWHVFKHAVSGTSVVVSSQAHIRAQVSCWRTRQVEKEKKRQWSKKDFNPEKHLDQNCKSQLCLEDSIFVWASSTRMSIDDQSICFASGLIELDKNHQAQVNASYHLLLTLSCPSHRGWANSNKLQGEPEVCVFK